MTRTPGPAFSHWTRLSASLLRSAPQLAGGTRPPDHSPRSDGRIILNAAMMTKKNLTLRQVAEYLKVHKSTIYRLVKRKGLPAFKVWHDWRFDLDLIDQWRFAQEQRAKTALRDQRLAGTWKHGGAAILNATTSSD